MRTETCDGCGATFRVKPNHPSWEVDAWCPACYPVVSQAHRLAYVLPAEVGRALRADDL